MGTKSSDSFARACYPSFSFIINPESFLITSANPYFTRALTETSHFLLEKARRSFRRWRSAVFSFWTTSLIFFFSSVNLVSLDCVFFLGFDLREEKDVLNRGGIGHNHAQAVNANAQPGGGRHAVFERA